MNISPALLIAILVFILFLILFATKLLQWHQEGKLTRKNVFKVFEIIIIVLSVAALLITTLYEVNFLQYQTPVPHERWKDITLKDFNGLRKPKSTLHGETKFAFISTSIRMRRTKDKILVEALFHPSRSYVYNQNLYSENLLTHELYHFHITEYYARLVRKEVSHAVKLGKQVNPKAIIKRMWAKERHFQKLYDEETYHSYVRGEQIEWERKIDSLLTTVEEYENSIITVP